MPLIAFILFLTVAAILFVTILVDRGKSRLGRWLEYGLVIALFLFAGLRSLEINSDTRSYADYSLHFQLATVGQDPETTDRLEWGFRVFLRTIAILLPVSDQETYPHLVNLTIAILSGLLLCRAVKAAEAEAEALLLIYMCSLFFVHQFAIVRLGLATLLFLNYFIPVSSHRSYRWGEIAFLCAGCVIHYTILTMAIVLLVWENTLRITKRPIVELGLFGSLGCLAVLFGTIADHLAPAFLTGYHLSLVTRNPELALSPKGMLEVTFCTALFLLHFKKIQWSSQRVHIQWRVLFYMTLIGFLVEVISGLPFVGRFRILAYCLFLMQTVLITGGINFKKKTTWLILLASAASISAQFITISRDESWSVVIAGQ